MKIRMTIIVILIFVFLIHSLVTFADPPGPPDPGGDPTGGGVPVGAPIDCGVVVLLVMGIAYAVWKFYSARKEKARELVNS